VLPELTDLNIHQVVRLALSRHERATGDRVSEHLETVAAEVPIATKICAYRIVQESLNNGYQHGGSHQAVAMSAVEGTIDLRISAELPSGPPRRPPRRERLGLLGMRLRVEALGGSISVSLDEIASVVHVQLPVNLTARPTQVPADEKR
jgi:signal transduction histidine kinase